MKFWLCSNYLVYCYNIYFLSRYLNVLLQSNFINEFGELFPLKNWRVFDLLKNKTPQNISMNGWMYTWLEFEHNFYLVNTRYFGLQWYGATNWPVMFFSFNTWRYRHIIVTFSIFLGLYLHDHFIVFLGN